MMRVINCAIVFFLMYSSILFVQSTTPDPSTTEATPPSPPSTVPIGVPGVAVVYTDARLAELLSTMIDIIQGKKSGNDLFKVFKENFQDCANRAAVEQAYIKSNYNVDQVSENAGEAVYNVISQLYDEQVRIFWATFMIGCDRYASLAYHLKALIDEEDARGITEILVICSESEESNTKLQEAFNQRFGYQLTDPNVIKSEVFDGLDGDVESLAGELLDKKRKPMLDKTDEVTADTLAKELVQEEKDSDQWSDCRLKLDESLLITPLNQCQLVIQKFSKDGKDLVAVLNEDFKDDEDKLNGYLQLVNFIKSKTSFYSEELYYGIQQNNYRYPLRIYSAVTKEDFAAIETEFKTAHPEVDLRKKIDEIIRSQGLGEIGNFAAQALAELWGSPSTPSPTTPSPSPPTP